MLPIAKIDLPIAESAEQRTVNARLSLSRGFPRFVDLPECQLGRFDRAALVSGGPSAADQTDTIKKFSTVIACGSTHDWLIGRGIVPAFCVIFDPGAAHASFYTPHKGVQYLVASTCAANIFDKLAGFDVRVWHPFDDLPFELYDNEPRVGGGSTVTLRAIALAHIMGLRELHMFGFDSCYLGGAEHAYPYSQDRPGTMLVNYMGEQFLTTPQLLQQAQEFMAMYFDHRCEIAIKVYGPGMIATVLKHSSLINLEPIDG